MKHKILSIFSALILSLNCICTTSLIVYASPDILGVTEETFNNWTDVEIANWFDVNFERLMWSSNGFVNAPSASDGLHAKFLLQADIAKAGTETYEQWIARNCNVVNDESGEPQVLISDELADAMYNACLKYIEEETGWYTGRTYQPEDFTSLCTDLNLYKSISNVVKSMNANEFAFIRIGYVSFSYKDSESVTHEFSCNCHIYVYSVDGFTPNSLSNTMVRPYYEWNDVNKAQNSVKKMYAFDNVGTDLSEEFNAFCASASEYNTSYPYPNLFFNYAFVTSYCSNTPKVQGNVVYLVRPTKETFRIYKTYEDYKDYSLGNRPYYITDKFQDYDINGDNSCILSESDLQNSSVYGDVTNYIINNYGDADGLTEQELIDILNKYFSELDLGGGGSGSGSGDSGGSGLSGFLSGIGSIGDAVLSILGKLLEYVGKALDLLSNTATKVIDLVPKNITNLLGGLFPFLPQEWLTAIELSLVLAVIIGIVGIFKK